MKLTPLFFLPGLDPLRIVQQPPLHSLAPITVQSPPQQVHNNLGQDERQAPQPPRALLLSVRAQPLQRVARQLRLLQPLQELRPLCRRA